ncbi:MAG TPA: N-acetyltransferase [Terracidiphilus sp.]|nr:N-acetyltransferase [Terracidiphilus sp.]
MLVRSERSEDCAAIRLVNEEAFGRRDEADLVDRLRAQGIVLASFVAEVEGLIVGHILFSRMSIETTDNSVAAVALAPLAVMPKFQRQGIATLLMVHGLDWLRGGSEQIVFVLGHPDYYLRFGFSTDKARFIDSPFNPKSFMALELKPNVLEGIRGKVRYPQAFGL